MPRKPGRKSLASLTTPNVTGEQPRITAPASLTPRERRLFNEIVAACAPDHFRDSDIPLLASFISATLMSRATANKPKLFATFEKATRLQASLACRLRLAPSTRTDPKTIARQNGRDFIAPWEDGL
jgi:hypothetical protein